MPPFGEITKSTALPVSALCVEAEARNVDVAVRSHREAFDAALHARPDVRQNRQHIDIAALAWASRQRRRRSSGAGADQPGTAGHNSEKEVAAINGFGFFHVISPWSVAIGPNFDEIKCSRDLDNIFIAPTPPICGTPVSPILPLWPASGAGRGDMARSAALSRSSPPVSLHR
jgi:hypothetical protein